MLTAFNFAPGIVKDDSPTVAENGRFQFIDADKVRFHRGKAQIIGGWERAFADPVDGVCRGLLAWRDRSGTPLIAAGTQRRLMLFRGGEIADITPLRRQVVVTNPVSVAVDGTVTLTDPGHGASVGDWLVVTAASAVAGVVLIGTFAIADVLDADRLVILAPTAPTGAGTGGGAVVLDYLLPAGQTDAVGSQGFGTGAFGLGPFGAPTGGADLAPRSWALANWGEDLLANPRGGGVYRLQPRLTGMALVANGDFSAGDSGWTVGGGWSISGGAASHATGTVGTLSRAVTVAAGATYRLRFSVTVSAGSLDVHLGAIALGPTITASGTIVLDATIPDAGTVSLSFAASADFSGSLTQISLTEAVRVSLLDGAPVSAASLFVASQRHVVALGCPAEAGGDADPMRLRWSDPDDPTLWTAAAANQAGEFALAVGSRIVAGCAQDRDNLIWTDRALYTMRFTGEPVYVFGFDLAGEGCGLIAARGFARLGGAAYWLAPGGGFWRYGGTAPVSIDCPLLRHLGDTLAPGQADKIHAVANARFGEVTWYYPSTEGGGEIDRYVVFNPAENHWSMGRLARTAGLDAGVFDFPLAVSPDGIVYFHEKGQSADGDAITARLESAPLDLADGATLLRLERIVPDIEDLVGGLDISLITRAWPQATPATIGPFAVLPATEKIDVIVTTRQLALVFASASAPSFWRLGAPRLDLVDTGMSQ